MDPQQSNPRHQEFRGRARSITSEQWAARHKRLKSNEKTLYHVTDMDSAQKIMQERKMLRGRGGLAGAGIYFAINNEDAKRKANAKGVLITCSVKLGNVKTISESGDSNVTFTGLVNEGFDSVLVPRKAGVEHVVYNCSQVDILKMEDLSNNKVLYTKSASDDNLNPSRHRSQSAHYYRSRHQASGLNGESRPGTEQPHQSRSRSSVSSSLMWPGRLQRIETFQQTLFNITDDATASKAAQSGKLQRRNGGIAGSGIYFYTTQEHAKSESSGPFTVLITCHVKLGNVKVLPSSGNRGITFTSLFNEGYDSVRIPGPRGDLFVVYNYDQVKIMKMDKMLKNAAASRYPSAYDGAASRGSNSGGEPSRRFSPAPGDYNTGRRSRSARRYTNSETDSNSSDDSFYRVPPTDGYARAEKPSSSARSGVAGELGGRRSNSVGESAWRSSMASGFDAKGTSYAARSDVRSEIDGGSMSSCDEGPSDKQSATRKKRKRCSIM